MRLKKLTLVASLLIAGSLLLYGCDTEEMLDVPPQGSLGEDVLADESGVEKLLIGTYAALDGIGFGPGAQWEKAADNWIYGSVAGGDAHKGTDAGDQPPVSEIAIFGHGPSNGFFNSLWIARYEGVKRANAVLQLISDVEEWSDDDVPVVAEAEARFLRAHYYFELKKNFNNVPWIDEETEEANQPNTEDIWPMIEDDFEFAMDNLPEEQSDLGRANSWAAASYLAKAYVYQEKWEDAQPLFEDIINNGVTNQGIPYDLFEEYKDNWEPAAEDGSPENVFSIEMTVDEETWAAHGNDGSILNYPYGGPFACCGFYQPTQMLVNSYKTDGGLPVSTGDDHDYNDDAVGSDQGLGSSDPYEVDDTELDPRVDWTAGRRGVPYHDWGPHPGRDWIRDQGYAGPYAPKKHVWWNKHEDDYADGTSRATAIDVNVIRFADVLLMAAEAEVEAGSIDQAWEYVNRVRARAANEDGWVNNEMNEDNALAVVDNEDDMLNSGASSGDFVVREDRNSTFVLLGGDAGDIDNWQEYEEPNYDIEEYPVPWTSQDEARDAVRFERKLELAMEGHRFYDLVRWGEAEQELNTFFDYESSLFDDLQGGDFQSNKNEYYPIPQNQIDLSTEEGDEVLEQNEGY